MKDITVASYDREQGCNRNIGIGECHEKLPVKPAPIAPGYNGHAGNQHIICDRMWPETCYVCDNGGDKGTNFGRSFDGCKAIVPKDPCKIDSIDPGYYVLPKECYERVNKIPKPKGEGKEIKPDRNEKNGKSSESVVPVEDRSAWQGSFDWFSGSHEKYLEDGDALAWIDKDDDSPRNDKGQTQGEEDSATDDKPVKDTTQEKVQQLRSEEKQLRDEAYSESWKAMRDGVGSLNPYAYAEHAIKANQKDWVATKKQWEADRLENEKKKSEETKKKQ